MAKERGYWLDDLATQWRERRPGAHVVCTGKSPTGPINIGFLRELILGDAVRRVLTDQGAEATLKLIVDEFDPLRDKQYAFLPDDFDYARWVGVPICMVPDPFGTHENFAEHFLAPLLRAMQVLGIEAEPIRASHMYADGRYGDLIVRAMEQIETVRKILREVAGRDVDPDWLPLSAVCAESKKLVRVKRSDLDLPNDRVHYKGPGGEEGYACFHKGETKLDWRVDWAARWAMLGTTVEPFGKDHSSRGGSWDTGRRIVEEVFHTAPPEPVLYEWIELKGQGAMSTSKGVGVNLEEMIAAVPPEIIRYLVLRARPSKAIQFDPFTGMLQVFNEYDRMATKYYEDGQELPGPERRVFELAQPRGDAAEKSPAPVPWRHLLPLLQIAAGDEERLRRALIRSGYEAQLDRWDEIAEHVTYAREWLERFADDSVKTTLYEDAPPPEAGQITPPEREFLGALAVELEKGPEETEIHNAIYQLATARGLPPADAFRAIYLAFLGRERGPRAGWFLHSLDPDFAARRLAELSTAVEPS